MGLWLLSPRENDLDDSWQVVVNMLDADHDGRIDYSEFVQRFQPQFAQMLRRRYGLNPDETLVNKIVSAVFGTEAAIIVIHT